VTLSPADRTILETRLRRLLHPAVLQEHRANPFGPYSPELQELLQFLRRSPDPTLPSYVLLARGTPQHWAIGRRAAVRGEPATQVDATTYATRGEAEHAVFLRRLVEHGLLPAAGPDDQAVAGTAVEPLPGLMGYLDTLSVAPGESIALHVHAEMPRWRADFVRLLCADMAPEGPALRETTVADVPPIECEGVRQRTRVGSFVRVDLPDDALDPARGFAMRCYVMPTLPGRGAQAFMSQRDVTGEFGWSLGLNAVGAPSLRSGEMRLDLDEPLVRGCWHLVEAAIDPARLALSCRPVGTRASNRVWIGRGQPQHSTARLDPIRPPSPSLPAASPLLLAAGWLDEDGQPQEQFDGRLERPTLLAVTASPNTSEPQTVLAAWDFAAGIGPNGIARPSHVEDVGPHGWHGRAFNHPTPRRRIAALGRERGRFPPCAGALRSGAFPSRRHDGLRLDAPGADRDAGGSAVRRLCRAARSARERCCTHRSRSPYRPPAARPGDRAAAADPADQRLSGLRQRPCRRG
jgi:N,N-dimethylformamidase